MKKFISLTCFGLLLSTSSAFALDSTGCGLGSIVFKGQSGTIPQLLAVTTNGTFGTQTFGISSGTSGCDQNGRISGGNGRIFVFLEKNLEQFAIDAARGQGGGGLGVVVQHGTAVQPTDAPAQAHRRGGGGAVQTERGQGEAGGAHPQ